MLRSIVRFAAPCAAASLSACAGGADALRPQLDGLRAEITVLHQRNDQLSRRLDALAARLDAPPPAAAGRPAAEGGKVEGAAPLVPPDLAVVRVAPPRSRAAPPIATAVPVAEPEPSRLEELSRPTGRELATEAEGELAAARRRGGLDRARALEAFVSRYPRHPSADNALVEAAREYSVIGRDRSACELARRVPEEYPAGDAVAGAKEFVEGCERSRP